MMVDWIARPSPCKKGEIHGERTRGRICYTQLDNPAGTFGEQELRVSQVAEQIVIGHTTEHLTSLRAALSA